MEPAREKQRHGCLTTWLVLLAIVYVMGAASSLFQGDKILQFAPDLPAWYIPAATVIALVRLACVAALFMWKKIGFWGLAIAAAGGAAMAQVMSSHMSATAMPVKVPPIVGIIIPFVFLAVLFGVLQIGKENKGWPQLE